MHEKKQRMITVTDNWHPCFDENKVRLTLSLNFFRNYYVKLSAWGADDTGVEIEYDTSDYDDAVAHFATLEKFYESIPDGVNRRWFLRNGFLPA